MTALEFTILVARIVGIISTISVFIVAFHKWSFKKGVENVNYAERRLQFIYGPLQSLLIDVHIISVNSILYPQLKLRIRRAYSILIKERELFSAFKALFDKGETKSELEVEFGTLPPITLFETVVNKNLGLVDTELLRLIKNANRSEMQNNLLGVSSSQFPDKEIMNLIEHVHKMHTQLSGQINEE